ncbi:MAG: hypothetical protein ACM31E_05260, partial [Fibrobacterota bacterium]
FPSTMRPVVMQQKFIDFHGEVNVVVFGRYQDFKEKVLVSNPDIVIAKPQTFQELNGYTERLNGLRNGSFVEPWVFVSVNNGVELDSIPHMEIGTIDFLGRVNTERFVAGMLNLPVNLIRATKIEDLLTMLTFDKVDAIFVPEGVVDYMKKTSRLKLVVTAIPACTTGIVTCAVRRGKNEPAIEQFITRLLKIATPALEIDQWKPVK